MTLAKVRKEAKPHVIEILEESHISQFLLNLCPGFESIRSALMNKEISPTLDTSV